MPDARQGQEADLGRIVALLEPLLGPAGGVPEPLEGGITNRNYRASFGGEEHVIRVPGKDTSLLGIDRDAERIANQRAAEAGIAPPVTAVLAEPPCIVTLFIAGRGMAPADLREEATVVEVARLLRAVHGLGADLPTSFDPFRIVREYAELAARRGGDVPAAYERAGERAEAIREALRGPEHSPVPCHNDLLAANFIRENRASGGLGRLWIVDWEYAGTGDRYFDLANFSVNSELGEAARRRLLAAYFDEVPGDAAVPPHRLAGLRLMAFMSDFREAMWGVVQSVVSELDFDFSAYAGRHFDRMLSTASDPEFDRWLEEAADVEA